MKKISKELKIFTLFLVISVCFSNCKKEKTDEPTNKLLNPNLNYGEVSDIEGNKYATIKIGDQTWMAQNLRTSRYANGDTIYNYRESWKWNSSTNGAWVHYNNDSAFDQLHGKLYNWYAINNPKNICPIGWHVPSDQDWSILIDFLGGSDYAGRRMKSKLNGAWANEYHGRKTNVVPSNESGFSAIASGSRNIDGQFSLMTYRAPFWSINVRDYVIGKISLAELVAFAKQKAYV